MFFPKAKRSSRREADDAAEPGELPRPESSAARSTEAESLAVVLGNHRFLAGIERRFTEELAACARFADYSSGELILREGQAADSLYLIVSGAVEIESTLDGVSRMLETLGGGDVLGLHWVLPSGRWSVQARALEPVRAVALDIAELDRAMSRAPDLGAELRLCALSYDKIRECARRNPSDGRGSW